MCLQTTGAALSVLLLCAAELVSSASDTGHCRDPNVDCIECDSKLHVGCRDPFDTGLVRNGIIPSRKCVGVCAKWVVGTGESRHIRRTCSRNIELKKVSPYLVCIDESRGNGQLCFCDKENCNAAAGAGAGARLVAAMSLAAAARLAVT